MSFIEAPTTFYMGRRYDPETQKITPEVVYYDSRDLVTHAVVVGMTGSGKTGLCINLLEEAILDNIPAIIIDPKGDITNLMLNFPDLRAEDFQPWVNVDDARRANMEVPQYAADVAHRWREGLASWGIVPDRMRWLQYAAHYSIYTPGSDAGLPVSILASLQAPREGWATNEEANREKINAIVTALLALVGRNSQPIVDKEHVLISNIFEYAWQRGMNLTLEDIIVMTQKPPFQKLGVFPIDEYISERARQKLALDLNSIIAAPSFQSWINGDPMDIQSLLYFPDGRPRVSIFYIAHLNEQERQFIITLLLENLLGWMRVQSGTTSLRALLYIDEMFGYFPPFPRNPPTKEPILRLLKQARAFGLGLILATQNPGDLDYKGLSNAGTWFIGRLQSDQDRERVMAGLEALASVNSEMTLSETRKLIAQIPPRVFVVHNVHDQGGTLMVHTRWAMSYLRGPLTRTQIAALMANQKQQYIAQAGVSSVFNQAPPAAVGAGGFAAQYNYYAQSAPAISPAIQAPQRQGVAPTGGFAPPPTTLPGFPAAPAGFPPGIPELPPDFQATQTAPAYNAPLPDSFASQQLGNSQPLGNTQQMTNSQRLRNTVTQSGVTAPAGFSVTQPPISSTVPQYFMPNDLTSDQALRSWEQRTGFGATGMGAATLAYKPILITQATVRYSDRKTQVFTAREYAYRIPNVERSGIVHWDEHRAEPVDPRRLSGEPFNVGLFGDLSSGLTDKTRLTQLRAELMDVLYTTARLSVPFNPTLNMYGNPDQDVSLFRNNLQASVKEKRDAEVDALTRKYEAVINNLMSKQTKTDSRLTSEKRELAANRREELFTMGEAALGLLRGRTAFTLSRISRSTIYKERAKGQVQGYELELDQLQTELDAKTAEFQTLLRETDEKWAKAAVQIEPYLISAFKKDIVIDLFGIGWLPFWYADVNGQTLMLPATA